jgi:hypothetical protein
VRLMKKTMIRKVVHIIILVIVTPLSHALAAVDTLKGASDIEDCIIYSWADCNGEITGEDCRRYNAGSITNLQVGNSELGRERRALLWLPGWDGTLPDSSKLLLYCKGEVDAADRKIFLYPVTTQFFEGTELSYNLGDYPDPDSGATWNHAWLDVGAGDSLNWSSAGGDYTTNIACTTIVTGTKQYFVFDNFNRILNYWDTSGKDYGAILINENTFPANTSMKTFGTTEGDSTKWPLVILYYPDEITDRRRLEVIKTLGGE